MIWKHIGNKNEKFRFKSLKVVGCLNFVFHRIFERRFFSILFIPIYAYLEIGILHIIVSLTDLMSTYLPRLSYLLHFSWWVPRVSICSNFWRENSAMWDLFTNPVLKRKEYNNTEDHQVRNWANQSHLTTRLTWLIHTSFLPSKWNLYP